MTKPRISPIFLITNCKIILKSIDLYNNIVSKKPRKKTMEIIGLRSSRSGSNSVVFFSIHSINFKCSFLTTILIFYDFIFLILRVFYLNTLEYGWGCLSRVATSKLPSSSLTHNFFSHFFSRAKSPLEFLPTFFKYITYRCYL